VGRLKGLRKADAEADGRPGALERRRLRRRLDRQERVREALLLDLGAIVFELHRQSRREPELLQAKATELRAVDHEVRGLADALEEGVGLPALTARGLVATCTGCDKLMGSRDRFCPSCGAAAGASPSEANGTDEATEPVVEPDFGDTIEAAALNGAGTAEGRRADAEAEAEAESEPEPAEAEAEAPEPESQEATRVPDLSGRGSGATRGNGLPRGNAESAVALYQRRMRAGRRIARQWLEQRRPDGP
jgi:hypothetical protein